MRPPGPARHPGIAARCIPARRRDPVRAWQPGRGASGRWLPEWQADGRRLASVGASAWIRLSGRRRMRRQSVQYPAAGAMWTVRELVQSLFLHLADVGGDDVGVTDGFLGQPFLDFLAVVENDQAIADGGDDIHVVLDEQDAQSEGLVGI